MADDAPASPFGNPPPVPAPVIEPPVTNPEAVRDMGLGFLAKHEGAMADRSREVDNIFSKQQLTVDNMSKMLDDTTASLKRAREGRSNLPLMALGAGMLSGTGNFGQQLGAGLKAMVPAIQQQRGDDEDFQYKLATLAMKRAGVENAPLQDKLAYLRALQTGDQASIRSTEAALLKASGQTEKAGAKDAQASATLEEKANKHAFDVALGQIKAMGEGHFSSPQERTEALISAYEATARSLKVPEPSIKAFSEAQRRIFDSRPKGGFTVPGDKPEEAAALGLGPKPVGYVYDGVVNPSEQLGIYKEEKKQFDKENKDQSANMDKYMGELKNVELAQKILKKYPDITGPSLWGAARNMQPPTPESDTLMSLFASNEIHSVPQGQGAISDHERTLFKQASPNMTFKPEANRQLLLIRQQILQDQLEKQKFLNTYFNYYKTSSGAQEMWRDYVMSPEGTAGFATEEGKVIPNPARISWKEYMAKKHGAPQRHAEGGMHKASPVYLGSEWDG